MKPQRIQLSRKKGWRMPPNTVKVTRPGIFGNPFIVGKDGTAEQCVERFRETMARNIWSHPNVYGVQMELRGKNLACWCKPGAACHADILLKVANSTYGEAKAFLIGGRVDREGGE